MPEGLRCGIATRLQVERILVGKVVACFTTSNPAVVRAEMPDRTNRYVDIEVGVEVGGPSQVTVEKPVEVYKTPTSSGSEEAPAVGSKKTSAKKKAK